MKKIGLIFSFVITVLIAQAQITFESNYPNPSLTDKKDFGIVKLDSAEHKYYYINYPNSTITLYNLDHSIYKTITMPFVYNNTLPNYRIYYLSKVLFDCDDSNLEYLLTYNNLVNPPNDTLFVQVYREDGTLLFNADSTEFQISFGGMAMFKSGIYQTEQGTKMILTKRNKSWDIYSLCGTLPAMLQEADLNYNKNPFPNPSASSVTIPYNLPAGVNYGNLKIVDASGKEVRNFKVDNSFNTIILNVEQLDAGNYVYYLETEKGISGSKKFIKL